MKMIDFENIPKNQVKIIKAICQHQLESLKRIYEGDNRCGTDLKLLLIQNDVTEDEFKASIEEDMDKFETVYDNPDDLRTLTSEDISKFRHLLTNISDDWKHKYPNSIKNLWKRLYLIEDIQNNQKKYPDIAYN